MDNRILGLHPITAIANNVQRNYDSYTHVPGSSKLMVKKTVNFDDPGAYHFYYGNLKLSKQYESSRACIEKTLPVLASQ